MPELPEVEITRRGIADHIAGQTITGLAVRQPQLRYLVPQDLGESLTGQRIDAVRRRAKYLLLDVSTGSILIHLGMSGSLRVLPSTTAPGKHDHVDLLFGDRLLRLHDPRRFGAVLWVPPPTEDHALLAHLGIEPLEEQFTGAWLYAATRKSSTPIKLWIMNAQRVVGIGNIYASESLFRARIHPNTRAGRLSLARCTRLVACVRETLQDALEAGGSTLRDFVAVNGNSGYFQQSYFVYAREGEPCRVCTTPIRKQVMGQRSTFFCSRCQRP
ncbi:bifunctional DNA-formamidopyrimidine glycosylase/DNA-(apurinic or apyrimidinic site) lyase [Uliginosibacterium sp. H3]|uniref:Formamidopyrimidine-DNA glycosylase n=1 Tax=Uliginosibacterium silvisoli TaxID=3114758 RepID=A0ABU6K319_9RHOO|nr:bifunctional DNA-formamidopyrimidine glycosylase/DNA-(apurinic or apyrimidinic site) lyase [Uliginosibacterium sp. H3]